jgi:hypothetical protein
MGASVGTTALAVILQREITAQTPGVAALGPLPDAVRESVAPKLAIAFSHSFWIALGIAVLALAPALLLPRTKA